jgi:DNA-binding transcriptional LysR family regulator
MQHKTQRYAAQKQRKQRPEIAEASWDDLRIFLVCVDHASFRRAAEALGTNNTTVMRHIDRLEKELGFAVFIRHQAGIRLTDEARDILNDLREMERLSFNVLRRASYRALNPEGIVRIAATEGVGTFWIMPKLVEFQNTYRLLTVDLRCAMEQADVARLEADISIQFERPTDPDLIVARLGRLHVYPFVSKEYSALYGVPRSFDELRQHRIVQQVAPQLDEDAYGRALRVDTLAGIIGIRTNSSTATLYAVEKSAGVGWLPSCSIALGAPLVAVDVDFRYHLELWMIYHPDLKRSEKHVVVIDWLKRIFDSARYPWFGDEFIHPNDLAGRVNEADGQMSVKGFAATNPLTLFPR